MNQNQYAPPQSAESIETSQEKSPRKFTAVLLQYVIAYLFGIVLGVAVTPARWILIDFPIGVLYPFLAPLGYPLFYLYLSGGYYPYGGEGTAFWILYFVGFVPFLMEAACFSVLPRSVRVLRPAWIAIPLGFVGTLGIYYAAAASI